ncbi:hypothetical protein H6F42_18930 [Pseudanabaena sp. FACHB-1998]|uniref:hypothetical protein n=1 Tax=Pseudanabaena sp. FACHB-1998 TaxID=2692858 RepID=UPI0016808D52|nr:hypothetical protein [Pseudanabaena sp. FACHB-1998]MBD2179001.1 hypothetical protein [Pseudanabaena sp. FACHB-1998]
MNTLQKFSVSNIVKKLSFATAGAACLTLGGVSASHAASIIDTNPSWNGSSFIFPFGEPNTATYGQTFTVTGSENILESFSFKVQTTSATPSKFAAYVAGWDGSKATSILYQSSLQTNSNNSAFNDFTFNTGGLALTSAQQYVAFISASNFFDGQPDRSVLGFINSDVYSGGQFVFLNNGSNFSALTQTNWSRSEQFSRSSDVFGDLAFKATFAAPTPVPVPGAVFGVIVAGGALVARQRKNAKAKQTVA